MATKMPNIIPRHLMPSRNDMVSIGMWGGTAALGGLWLVQPWGWIKAVTVGDEEVEEEAQQDDEGRGQPKPPAAESGEDTKASKENEDDSDDKDDDKDEKDDSSEDKQEGKADNKDEEDKDDSKDSGKSEGEKDEKED